MGIVISDTVNKFSESLICSPTVSSILINPIYTAVLVAVFCMLITLYVFRDEDVEESTSLCIRTSFYVFLTTLGILFLYDKKTTKDMREKYTNGDMDRVMSVVNGGRSPNNLTEQMFNDEVVPVTIRTSFEPESPALSEPTNASFEVGANTDHDV